jgi:PST family polysaccharide transporter
MSAASGGWMVLENLQKLTFYRSVFAGLVNLALNWLLIPKYGINGSAAALVIAQACASFLSDLFHPRTRPIFWMKIKAFNPASALAFLRSNS